jgi:hypothetical protein
LLIAPIWLTKDISQYVLSIPGSSMNNRMCSSFRNAIFRQSLTIFDKSINIAQTSIQLNDYIQENLGGIERGGNLSDIEQGEE